VLEAEMTKVDEIALAIRAKSGDQRAMVELYNQYLPMMHMYCRKYKILDNLTQEDLLQYCALYFMGAIEKFDPSRDNKFGTMLHVHLQQISRDVIYQDMTIRRPSQQRGEKTEFKCMSVDAKISDCLGGDSTDTFADVYEDETARFWEFAENAEENRGLMKIVHSELQSLDPLPRTIVELCIYTELRHEDIAHSLDVQIHVIRRQMKYFRENMRKRCEKAKQVVI